MNEREEMPSGAKRRQPGIEATAEELQVTRDVNASGSLVFKALTDPAQLIRWWDPKGFTTPAVTVDLRVGGIFHFCVRAPDGMAQVWAEMLQRPAVDPAPS